MNCEVSLENMEFFAYHGYYDEEQKVGNRYSVDVCIIADVGKAAEQDKLQSTINYEKIYALVKQQMDIKARLLEHFAYKIILQLFQTFATAKTVEVTVRKHNPPIGGVCGAAKIVLKMSIEEYLLLQS
jgi:dihydroneopterin aldolase